MNHNTLQSPLDFLEELFPSNREQFDHAWLKTPFVENFWFFDFSAGRNFEINFNIELENGTSLTDESNRQLLNIFKNWITIQASPSMNQGSTPSSATAYHSTRRALHIIDYLLMHKNQFKLATYGLSLITENDVISLFYRLASSNKIIRAVYDWDAVILKFFLDVCDDMDDVSVDDFILKNPLIYKLMIDGQPLPGLSTAQTIKAKIWLFNNDYYEKQISAGYRFWVQTNKLASLIYKSTLLGSRLKTTLHELCFAPYENISTEYNAASVRATNDTLTDRGLARYYASFMSISKLSDIGLNPQLQALNNINLKRLTSHLEMARASRYKTLKPSILLPTFKKAIEFVSKFGDDILLSASAIIIAHAKYQESVNTTDAWWVKKNLSPLLEQAGVQCWSLSTKMLAGRKLTTEARTEKLESYFERFRSNEGLWELVRVYYGAAQIIIGLLMARRQEELRKLKPFQCLDKAKRNLIFQNGKSGISIHREVLRRPIPAIGVRIIESIQQFQKTLVDNKIIANYTHLFAFPDRYAKGVGTTINSPSYNRSIDYFCDYTQTPLDANNERYYIRQHQLRRGFAMMFFWGNSFGGLETLRWFLGHTDTEHLYHYITETTPGEVLRGVKAAYLTERLIEGHNQTLTELQNFLLERFGTTDFTILDPQEIEDYLDALIEEETISVEPHFLKSENHSSYQIVTKLKKHHE